MTTLEPDYYPFQNGPDGWPLVRRLLADALQIYGNPAKIMFGRMREGARRGIRNLDRRLRALLELVRRLILIEALLITAPDLKRRGKRKQKRALPVVEIIPLTAQHWSAPFNDKPRLSEDPSKWRVSLQLFPIVGLKPANPPPPIFSTSRNKARSLMLLFRRIANRLEALRRIAASPPILHATRCASRKCASCVSRCGCSNRFRDASAARTQLSCALHMSKR